MNREKAKQLFKSVNRFFRVFLGFLLPVQIVYLCRYVLAYDPFDGPYTAEPLTVAICLLMLIPLFFSLVRISTVYDRPSQEAFYASPVNGFKEMLVFWFRQKQFWTEAAVFAVLYLLLPIKWTSAVLVQVFCKGNTTSSAKMGLLAVYLPVLFLLHLAARLSAMQVWTAVRKGKDVSKWQLDKKKAMNGKIASLTFVCGGGGCVLSILLPILPSLLPFAKEALTASVVVFLAVLLLSPTVFRTLRAFRKRRAFLKRFASICKEKGYDASAIRYPFRSLFFLYRGESFRVTVGGKEYACKLLCAKNRLTPLALYADGNCQFARSIRFLNVELFQYDRVGYFGYEAECQKILILNPVPNRVVKFDAGKAFQLDNGDSVGAYKIYTATAFLNAMEREVLDR